MLHFFPPGMAQRYFLFALLATLGTLQLIAAHGGWIGLALLGQWQRPWGYLLGGALLAGAYLWFFGTAQSLIFRPGLAGAELFTVFGAATLAAVALTLGLASLFHGTRQHPEVRGEPLQFEPGRGTVRWPDGKGPWPTAILISDLPSGHFPLQRLADALLAHGVSAVVTDLGADGAVTYPEVLARLPALVQGLQSDGRLDANRVALLGVGLGGDLALRATATDPSIAAVAAIDPVLEDRAGGLDLLRRMTWWEALRWAEVWQRLTRALGSADHATRLADRPALILATAPATSPPGIPGVENARVASEAEAAERVTRWLVHHLVPVAGEAAPRMLEVM